MKTHNTIILFLFGSAFWAAGTVWYQMRGQLIFETTGLRYWVNLIVTPVVTTLVCVGVFRWRHIPAGAWSSAALLVAIPGMLGEAVLLSRFSEWMPTMQAASAGRYGGFLFATYALVLGVAEAVTLRAGGR
jgi:hypothetical protein